MVAPLQFLKVSSVQTQFFREPLLGEMVFHSKLPNVDNPKGEKQVLVLPQVQDLLLQCTWSFANRKILPNPTPAYHVLWDVFCRIL